MFVPSCLELVVFLQSKGNNREALGQARVKVSGLGSLIFEGNTGFGLVEDEKMQTKPELGASEHKQLCSSLWTLVQCKMLIPENTIYCLEY